MRQILIDVLKGYWSIFSPPKPPRYIRPHLCKCTRCGNVHYSALLEE